MSLVAWLYAMYLCYVSVLHTMTKLDFAEWGLQKCLCLAFIVANWNGHMWSYLLQTLRDSFNNMPRALTQTIQKVQ